MKNLMLPLLAVFVIVAVALSSKMAISQGARAIVDDTTSDTTTYYYYEGDSALESSPVSGFGILLAIFAIASTTVLSVRLVKIL